MNPPPTLPRRPTAVPAIPPAEPKKRTLHAHILRFLWGVVGILLALAGVAGALGLLRRALLWSFH